MSLLDKVNYPADLRKLKKEELKQLTEELRKELINVVSTTGGHLGAGLGVVELTVINRTAPGLTSNDLIKHKTS